MSKNRLHNDLYWAELEAGLAVRHLMEKMSPEEYNYIVENANQRLFWANDPPVDLLKDMHEQLIEDIAEWLLLAHIVHKQLVSKKGT